MYKDDEYYTPKSIVDMFGKFDYDPATNDYKAQEFGVKEYDTIETDGLKRDWTKYNRIWCNPPFTKKKEFFTKAQDFYDKTGKDILLPANYLVTKVFHGTIKGGTIYIPNRRINFESGNGKVTKSPNFVSVIIKLAKEWKVELIKLWRHISKMKMPASLLQIG